MVKTIIDLSQFERRPDPFKGLPRKIEVLSAKLNREVKEEYGLANLINPDGSISVEAFSKDKGGIYEKAEINEDQKDIKRIESSFVGLEKPGVREFYKEKFKLTEDDAIIARWKADRANQKSGRVEALITILLNRLMGDQFLIVKSATYDDYKSGVDHLIVDKHSGSVVGAFDEVAVNDNSTGTENSDKKRNKVNKITQQGGAQVKYGLQIKDSKLKMTSLQNLPVFYLGLTDANYKSLSHTVDKDLEESIAKEEKEVLNDLIASLTLQIKEIKIKENLDKNLLANIHQFELSLKNYSILNQTNS